VPVDRSGKDGEPRVSKRLDLDRAAPYRAVSTATFSENRHASFKEACHPDPGMAADTAAADEVRFHGARCKPPFAVIFP